MAVFQQCPICRAKQKNSLKKCRSCGEDLVKAKKGNRVKYWICYQLQGKKKWKCIGPSLIEAQDADAKIRTEKRENPFFSEKDHNLTFSELASWYTGLIGIQKKKYFPTVVNRLRKWNEVFCSKMIVKLKKSDVENYQAKRIDEGYAKGTIDAEVLMAQMVVQAAIDDDRISGDCIKPFRRVKKLLKEGANARNSIITYEQFCKIMELLPEKYRGIISLGFFGGMRQGEILGLTWDKVNLQCEVPYIKLSDVDTKEAKGKIIPLAHKATWNPYDILKGTPRALHNDHVFSFRGGVINRCTVERKLEEVCKKTGIVYGRNEKDGFIFHDLRHCFNTYMRRAGVDQLTIMTIMGHSPGKGMEMTYRYSTFELADLGQAISKMECLLIGLSRHQDSAQS